RAGGFHGLVTHRDARGSLLLEPAERRAGLMRSTILIYVALATPSCFGGLFTRAARPSSGNATIALRKRLHINTLIAEPGTAEIDWGNLYSFSTTNFAMPSGLRYTPAGRHVIWGRT